MNSDILTKLPFWLIVIILFSCSYPKEKKELSVDSISQDNEEKLRFQEKMLLGKEIDGLAKILGDTVECSRRVVLFYTGFDCGSCIETGFRMVNAVDRLGSMESSIVIECQANKSSDQITYSYPHYIFSDADDLLRKSLKYVKTPVVFFLDEESRLKRVYYPVSGEKIDSAFVKDFLSGL
ncbi:MAG: hypothetical protein WAZ98_10105 [Cyclobacteriaceae bacterium]